MKMLDMCNKDYGNIGCKSSLEIIEKLFLNGVDVFRLNFFLMAPWSAPEELWVDRSLEKNINANRDLAGLPGPNIGWGSLTEGKVI